MLKKVLRQGVKNVFPKPSGKRGRYTYIYSHSMTYMKNKRYD